MQSKFTLFVTVGGAVILLSIGFWVHHRQSLVAATDLYQASAFDNFVASSSAPIADAPEEVDSTIAEERVVVPEEDPASLITPAPVIASASAIFTPPIIPDPPIPAAPVVIASPPPSPIGSGGILTNRPVEQPTPEPAPEQPAVATEEADGSTSTEAVVAQSAEEPSSTPPIVTTEASTTTEEASTTPTVEPSPTPPPTTPPATTPANHLVISEVFIDMVGADNSEFIELYNPTDATIDLSNSSLQYVSSGAASISSITKKNFSAGATIAAHGFYLVGAGTYAGSATADALWSQSLSNTGATIFLVSNHDAVSDAADQDILDRLAYGGGALLLGESSPAPLPPVGQSIERRAVASDVCAVAASAESNGNGCDTDSNAGDFDVRVAPGPQNTASNQEF